MRVDGLIFANDKLIETIRKDQAPDQVANVATLPGIQKASLAMPDIHWGYGFCIGGVCATDPDEGGVISPGGVGYDINCGVRLVKTNLFLDDVKRHIRELVKGLFYTIPTGVGRSRASTSSTAPRRGGSWARGRSSSSTATSACRATSTTPRRNGRIDDGDPHEVSDHAVQARVRAVRHARQRQPLPRSAGRRRGLRRGRREGRSASN